MSISCIRSVYIFCYYAANIFVTGKGDFSIAFAYNNSVNSKSVTQCV